VKFCDGTHNVEVLPALEKDDSKFCIPNTEDGGVFQFEVHHSSRKALIATADVFGSSNNKFNSLTFHASKYGKSSYDIDMSSLPVGEYGVIVSNPNNRDSKSALIYCFGVGKPKAHSGWRQYNPDGVY
jgi:hypothetical protein